mgnify:CR=1 FL=1
MNPSIMSVSDGDGKRVGFVLADLPTGREQGFDHHAHLLFGGVARADNRFFDLIGGIFSRFNAVKRGHGQKNTARLAEFEGAGRVFIDEGFLDGGSAWVPRLYNFT